MQVAAYARVSTRRQAQMQNTEQQIERLLAHAEGQGWSSAADRVFRDDGHSGASLRRPGLDRLRDAAASAGLDRILDYYVRRTKTPPSSQSPGERCPTRHIPGGPLEELVWRDLCEVLAAPEMIAHAVGRVRDGHWLPQEMQAQRANLRRARAGLHQRIERLTEAYLAGVVPLSEYQRRRWDTEGRLLVLDGQERELVSDADRQTEAARLGTHAEAFRQRVRHGLEQADFDRERELLEPLIDRVIVTGQAVEIRYVIPVGPGGEREPFCRLRTDHQSRVPGPRDR